MLKRSDDAWNVTAPRVGKRLTLDALQRSFGKRGVLNGLSLEVPPGQFVAIVGRSGVGKSTLMRLIVGLDQPNAGRVLIDGAPVAGLQKSVGLLFQDPRLLPWQTVLGNVGIARLPEWRETALKALEEVGLADRRDDWPAMLSGGQRQRVALARVLVARPNILLLDERSAHWMRSRGQICMCCSRRFGSSAASRRF